MNKKKEIVCEVLFTDFKTGKLSSMIGYLDENKLDEFDFNEDNFITFKNWCISKYKLGFCVYKYI